MAQHLFEWNLATLDREEQIAKLALECERRNAMLQPTGGRHDEAHEIVRILRPELARKLEIVRALRGKTCEGIERRRAEQTLIVQRSIELLYVFFRLMARVCCRSCCTRPTRRQAFGNGVE